VITLTAEQKSARDAAVEFALKGSDHMTIGGYAGVGKTVVIAEIAKAIYEKKPSFKIAFCCYTAKAASVLREKLYQAEVFGECSTIHHLIYKPRKRSDGTVEWNRVSNIEADLVVIDEASMVNEDIWMDLQSFGVPILAVGDHGQLPPIQGSLNLMEKPDIKLEKIHRQAEGNPIIKLATMARTEGSVPAGEYSDGVRKILASVSEALEILGNPTDIPVFLCGYNWTRVTVNKFVRKMLKRKFFPEKGDRVICLKNNYGLGVFNGVGGVIEESTHVDKHLLKTCIVMDDGESFDGNVLKQQFCHPTTMLEVKGISEKEFKKIGLFDFGYCLTVHKAQGSEAESVVLFEERFSSMTDDDWRRWLYTGISRARKNLTIVGKRGK